jgi:hypothetical protein
MTRRKSNKIKTVKSGDMFYRNVGYTNEIAIVVNFDNSSSLRFISIIDSTASISHRDETAAEIAQFFNNLGLIPLGNVKILDLESLIAEHEALPSLDPKHSPLKRKTRAKNPAGRSISKRGWFQA